MISIVLSKAINFLTLNIIGKYYVIEGNSMYPLLCEGDVIFIKKTKNINVGSIIVANHPFRKKNIIKQVTAMQGDMLELKGLNLEESEDSRTFGYISIEHVLGTVILYKPKCV